MGYFSKSRFLKTFLGIAFAALSYQSMAMQNRCIFIFLNDFEKDVGSSTSALYMALDQQAAPILVSAFLVRNAFSQLNNALHASDDAQELIKNYDKAVLNEEQGCFEAIQEQKALILKVLAFQSNDWVIKKISNQLFLFIPKRYLNKIGIADNDMSYKGTSGITETEQHIGLKVNHLHSVELMDVLNKSFVYDMQNHDHFIKSLSGGERGNGLIFCEKGDYIKEKSTRAQPQWAIYLDGHGTIGEYIANLTFDDFKKFLLYLNSAINTALLMYSSCFSSGMNNEVFGFSSNEWDKNIYKFAIATESVPDAIAVGFGIVLCTNDAQKIGIDATYSLPFERFVDRLLACKDFIPYKKIAGLLMSPVPHSLLSKWSNVPHIKLPDNELFCTMANHYDIARIGGILAANRDRNCLLKTASFFSPGLKALMLHAQNIPFELVIDNQHLEAIISMLPGDAYHTLKKIRSCVHDEYELISLFCQISSGDQVPCKVFFVKQLNEFNDVIITNTLPETDETEERKGHFAFYYNNATLYKWAKNDVAKKAGKHGEKLYGVLRKQICDHKSTSPNGDFHIPEKINGILKGRLALLADERKHN